MMGSLKVVEIEVIEAKEAVAYLYMNFAVRYTCLLSNIHDLDTVWMSFTLFIRLTCVSYI